ncbi:MAG: ATP synthase F0 subunit B [Bdellovibrionales bacterium]|nr:ATP synthase F0 subunit B [Bdellovibrionales bacterium]
MISKIVFALIVLMPTFAIAAGGEHDGIPWKTVGIQLFNFSVLFGFLFYILKQTVVQHFKDRKQSYTDLVGRAEKAKAEAEAHHREISQRLKGLESSAKENASKAQSEAELLKARLLKEADELVEKLKQDVEMTAKVEIEKAKNQIQSYALKEALSTAESQLKSQASGADQSRLNSEFIDKIQAVPR